jgi:hypothetical protein
MGLRGGVMVLAVWEISERGISFNVMPHFFAPVSIIYTFALYIYFTSRESYIYAKFKFGIEVFLF